jgi:CHAD domain-containing protein
MALDVPARSYALPDAVDAASLVALLSERLDLVTEPTRSATVVVVDTADRRLRTAGADLMFESVRGGGHRLVLRQHAGGPRLVAEAGRPRRTLVEDLPAGALRDHLAPLVEMRALLPLARLRVAAQPLRVLNGDGKTVVRLTMTTRAVVLDGDGGDVMLAPQLDATGVLGYVKDFERVARVLTARAGLTETSVGVVDQAVAALGGDPTGIRTKVAVRLRPDDRTDQGAVAVLVELADMVEAHLGGTLDDIDTEFLHDLRVAVRRSRSVLREMKQAFPPDELGPHRDTLRWIQEVTGDTRDLDVQLLEWANLVAGVPGTRRAALEPVRGLLVRHRTAAFRAMRRELRSTRFTESWRSYRAFLDAVAERAEGEAGPSTAPAGQAKGAKGGKKVKGKKGKGAKGKGAKATKAGTAGDGDARAPDAARPVAAVAGRRIVRVYERMVQEGSAIDATSPATALHDLRKRGKELRYLLELFGGLWPPATVRPMVGALKDLQGVLGTHQDREVQADHLRSMADELAATSGGPDALLALGALVDRLDVEQDEARAGFAERFAAFAAPDQQRVVADTFGAGA